MAIATRTLLNKFQSEMTPELLQKQKEEFSTGPLSMLTQLVKNNIQVLINCGNNKKLLGLVKTFDGHCNMVLENVKEMCKRYPKAAKTMNKDHDIYKMFLKGDSVIVDLRNPFIAGKIVKPKPPFSLQHSAQPNKAERFTSFTFRE